MTPPHHFDRFAAEWRNLTSPGAQATWEQEISRLSVSIEYQVLTAYTGVPAQDDQNGEQLTVKEKPQKKGCEEIKAFLHSPFLQFMTLGAQCVSFVKRSVFQKENLPALPQGTPASVPEVLLPDGEEDQSGLPALSPGFSVPSR